MSVGEVRTTEQKLLVAELAEEAEKRRRTLTGRTNSWDAWWVWVPELLAELDAQAARVRELEDALTDARDALRIGMPISERTAAYAKARVVLAGGKTP